MGWDKEVDLLVVGSGAGGLLSALVGAANRADVLIVDKESQWGGTSATSGAGIWIPASDQAAEAGFHDTVDDAFRYVRGLSADNVPDANIRAYVSSAADMLRWMGANTAIQYCAFPYPDYHAENPGGSPTGYRTHMPLPIDGRGLGRDVETLRFASPAASLFGYLNWHFDETYVLLFRQKGWFLHLVKSLARYWFDLPFRFKSRKDRRLTLGNALVGHSNGLLTPASQYAYQKAATLSPDHPAPPFFLGLALATSGQLQQARAIWAELLERSPPDAAWREDLTSRLARIDALIAQQDGAPAPGMPGSVPPVAEPGQATENKP